MSSRQHHRFSWQPPLEEEAPAYTEVQEESPSHVPHASETTAAAASRHFSYGQTPVEHRAFVYTSKPSDPPLPRNTRISVAASLFTPIDPRPQSMLDPLNTSASPQPQTAYVVPSHSQYEKAPVSPLSNNDPRALPPSQSPVSPVPAPYATQRPVLETQQSRHARQMSNLSPINTNVGVYPMPPIPPTPPSGMQTSPLPHKTPVTPISAASTRKDLVRENPTSPSNRKSYANEPYSPHGFTSGQTNNMHAVFSPDAAHGPNGLDFALHQPGQIAHPNMESGKSHSWNDPLCACTGDVSTCLTGLVCPCILYGRTSYRLSQKSAKKDPTDMLGHSAANGHCMAMGLSCGLWWLFPMLQRTRIRHAYKLGGSFGSDLLRGCCCCCCVAVQNEREVRSREEASRRWAGPASTDVYTRTSGMLYKPQQ